MKAAAPAKEALHVLEEGVCPLPGRQALLPLVPAAHCAAADQVSISSVRTFVRIEKLLICNFVQPLCDGIGGGGAGASLQTKTTALLTLAPSTGLPHPSRSQIKKTRSFKFS